MSCEAWTARDRFNSAQGDPIGVNEWFRCLPLVPTATLHVAIWRSFRTFALSAIVGIYPTSLLPGAWHVVPA